MLKRILCLLALCGGLMGSPMSMAAGIQICYHYGCKKTAVIQVAPLLQQQLADLFRPVVNAAGERQAMAVAVQRLYQTAGQQSPIFADKGGNFADGSADGRMDCVDHSSNSTAFLQYLAQQGWLKFHRVTQPVYRAPRFFDLHYAARVETLDAAQSWVVDSWFHDFGSAPEVVEQAVWQQGWVPPQNNGSE